MLLRARLRSSLDMEPLWRALVLRGAGRMPTLRLVVRPFPFAVRRNVSKKDKKQVYNGAVSYMIIDH